MDVTPRVVFETGREYRLTWLVELIEAAHQLGDQVKVEVIEQVLAETEAELNYAGRHVPATADLSPEEYRAVAGLLAMGGALQDVVGYLAATKQPGRLRNQAMRLVDQLMHLCADMVGKAPPDLRTAVLTEAASWGYILLHPGDRVALLAVIDAASSTKGYVPAETRALARQLADQFGGLRKSQEAHEERQAALK